MSNFFKLVLGVFMFFSSSAKALELNQPAPAFKAASTSGQTVSLTDFAGKWVVLYFYPKAFTPGCTAESCALRDAFAEIQKLNAVILGVSLDTLETQNKFKAEHKMQFDLLSDESKTISKDYNTLGLLGLYSERKTFIIDPKGILRFVFESVTSKTHDQEVLSKLKELQK